MSGEWDCIEFVHTVGWEARDREDDELSDVEGLTAWCARRGILVENEVDTFLAQALKRPERFAATLERAHRLRVLAYESLRTISGGGIPAAAQVEELNALLQQLLPGRRLGAHGGALRWEWRMDAYRPDSMLAPVAWSLATLLTSPDRDRVKVCDGPDCGWMFVDASRNRSRRWCDMSDCGNRAKVRRYRRRGGAASR